MADTTLAKIVVLLGGGCELLFKNQPRLELLNVVPVGSTVDDLVVLLKTQYIAERPELLVDVTGTTLRPGVLALVNGCDVEVLGGMSYQLNDKDEVELISTLHGG